MYAHPETYQGVLVLVDLRAIQVREAIRDRLLPRGGRVLVIQSSARTKANPRDLVAVAEREGLVNHDD